MNSERRVKCPECAEVGQRSRVFPGGTVSTLMAGGVFYDEDGEYHNHDPNRKSTEYQCSGGHTWYHERYSPCPRGDYPDEPQTTS